MNRGMLALVMKYPNLSVAIVYCLLNSCYTFITLNSVAPLQLVTDLLSVCIYV